MVCPPVWRENLQALASRLLTVQTDEQCSISLVEHDRSTPVISKSNGPSETLRDIRTSTYQILRIEQNTNRTTKIHK